MSNAAKIEVPDSGDNGKAPVYNSGTDAFDLVDVATASELAAHEADSTSVHGISNTANLISTGTALGGVLGGTLPNPSFAADMATQAELDAHVNDSSAAHAASAVSFSPTGTIAGSDVQTAVAEVATDAATALAAHEADTTGIHGITDTSALVTTSTSLGGVLGGTVGAATFAADMATQAELDAHVNDSSAAHAASAVSFSPTGTIAGSDVQTAVAEVASEAATNLANHEADTTSIHGITDTSVLVTLAGSQTLTNKSLTASQVSDFAEAVDDRVGVLVVGGTGITATYNDGAGTHTIATTITQYTDEMARDALGTALTAGSGITITPNDGADTITIAATGGGGGGSVATDTIFDAKGDLPAGTGSDTAAKRTVGTNGQALTADSSQSTGLAYYYHFVRAAPSSSSAASGSCRANSTGAPTQDRLYYILLPLAVGHAYTAFGTRVAVASASGVLRIGIYTPGSNGKPGALITDGGTVTSASTGVKSVSISYTPVHPFVFVGIVPQTNVGSLTLPCSNNNGTLNAAGLINMTNNELPGSFWYEDSITGALPSSPGTLTLDANQHAANWLVGGW